MPRSMRKARSKGGIRDPPVLSTTCGINEVHERVVHPPDAANLADAALRVIKARSSGNLGMGNNMDLPGASNNMGSSTACWQR